MTARVLPVIIQLPARSMSNLQDAAKDSKESVEVDTTPAAVDDNPPPAKRQRTSDPPFLAAIAALTASQSSIPPPEAALPTLYLGIDPGPVNCGWALVRGDTGMLVACGVLSCVRAKDEIGTAPYIWILRGMQTALRNNHFVAEGLVNDPELRKALLENKVVLKVGIERQALHDSLPSHISRATALIEELFHFHYFETGTSVLYPQAYKRHFLVESNDDKRNKTKATERFWDLIRSESYTVEPRLFQRLDEETYTPHEIEAALMAWYMWDMRYRPTIDMEKVVETGKKFAQQKKSKK